MYLSPIRFLMNEVKNVFNINIQSFFDTVQKVVTEKNEKIKIKVVCKPLVGIGASWHIDTCRIDISEELLCALWCASYFVANAYVSLSEYLKDDSNELQIEDDSLQLLKYAKSLVPSFTEWSEELPVPQDFETNPYAKLANLIMPIATDVIISHELAHLFLNHIKNGDIQQEIEADNLAVSWILDQKREEYPLKELAVMTSFITMILIDQNADKDGEHHPSSFNRMKNYLGGLKIEETDNLWTLAILTHKAWETQYVTDHTYPLNSTEVSGRDIFESLIK